MKVLINQILPLQEVYEKVKNQIMPIKTAYKINKLFSSFMVERNFYVSELKKILDQYAMKDENDTYIHTSDGSIKIIPDQLEVCHKKLIELDTLEIELPDIYFTLEELEGFELTIQDMATLELFIKE